MSSEYCSVDNRINMSVDAHDIMHLNTKSRPVKCLGGRVKGGGREEGGGRRVEGG